MKSIKSLLLVCMLVGNCAYVPQVHAIKTWHMVLLQWGVVFGGLEYTRRKLTIELSNKGNDLKKSLDELRDSIKKTNNTIDTTDKYVNKLTDKLIFESDDLNAKLERINNKLDKKN